jgi:hypothetical protein
MSSDSSRVGRPPGQQRSRRRCPWRKTKEKLVTKYLWWSKGWRKSIAMSSLHWCFIYTGQFIIPKHTRTPKTRGIPISQEPNCRKIGMWTFF